jgi:hypothetical protein
MILYHGTASRHLPSILKNGLTPRNQTQVSNWDHSIPSNHETVYLTDSYALYFSAQACEEEHDDRLVVLEIDTDMLNEFMLCADEDAVEQTNRGKDDVPGTMEERTMYYRERAHMYDWRQSLKALGTCGYQDSVPLEAITRAALVDMKTYAKLVWAGYDPSISVMNYQFCGAKYRNAMQMLFEPGLKPEVDVSDPFSVLGMIVFPEDRSGIEVLGIKEVISRFSVV